MNIKHFRQQAAKLLTWFMLLCLLILNWSPIANVKAQAIKTKNASLIHWITGDNKELITESELDQEHLLDVAVSTSSNWSLISSMPWSVSEVSAVTNAQYIYVVGGANGSPYTSSVIYAQVNTDGGLGEWIETTSMPRGQVAHNAVLISHGYLFVIGGYACCWGGLRSVISAPIQLDGTLGDWTILTSLPDDLYRSAAVVYGDSIYVLGGFSDFPGEVKSAAIRRPYILMVLLACGPSLHLSQFHYTRMMRLFGMTIYS
ncbi:MAG: hypothetical protein HY863_05910 [Chloroflexi bacterium]|nr:hypothetical protein [Chloroflexota bacterium]